MKNIKFPVLLMISILWIPVAQSATEKQLAAIGAMGKLNGIALQCSFKDQMQRIKMNLVLHLPKQRELGVWFEQTTNKSFMEFMSNDATCPDEQEFKLMVDGAVEKIEKTFKQ